MRFDASARLTWNPVAGADFYNVYRGKLSDRPRGVPARCHGHPVDGTSFDTPSLPDPGDGFFYLVTGQSAAEGEGSPGTSTSGEVRPLLGLCGPVMRNHVLDRLGFGWSEWSRDRLAALGSLEAYIDEQLDPDSIDESTNTALNERLALYDPPASITELIGRQVIGNVYARRQLAEQVADFWSNHFNTGSTKVTETIGFDLFPLCSGSEPLPECDPNYPTKAQRLGAWLQLQDTTRFRDLTFAGNFRQMLEVCTLSPAMIIYLDTYTNVAAVPNENYAREILELYALGVDNGYTQADIVQLARVFTGWSICKKELADVDDPLAPCISHFWEDSPPGEWVANFQTNLHDCGKKVLFPGTPYEVDIPTTCANPTAGVQDLQIALDGIAAHPSTPRFISRKILQRFVTDEPTQEMVDALVAEWNDASNPHGVGDMREVLRAALHLPAFLDPDRARSKVKTPLEHIVSALRATRGTTDGISFVLEFLNRAQHLPHANPVPTGYPEVGSEWIDTNNTLERQNFGIMLETVYNGAFKSDVIDLLQNNGVSTAPGNSAGIVDFLTDAFFGGAVTPAERQAAIDFLNTDEAGKPSPYEYARIRQLTTFLLGSPQFQEQ